MSFDLDDLWLDKLKGKTDFSQQQMRRLYRIIMVGAVGASYLVDTLLLWLFYLTGTIDVHVPLIYAGLGLGHVALFALLHWSGFSDRLNNPHMTAWQMSYAIAVQIFALALAPQMAPFFLGATFVIFAFGTLRINLSHALVIWFCSVVFVFYVLFSLGRANLGLIMPSRMEVMLFALTYATLLLRSIALGYYATALRMRMYEKSQAFEQAATYDALTGSLNRGVIKSEIEAHISLCQRNRLVSCVAMIDIDHFKTINDTLGHIAGDGVLKKLVEHMRAGIRDADRLGRFGGEEFLIVMPMTDLDEAVVLVERIRENIAALAWDEIDGELAVTVSGGITVVHLDDSVESVVSRADEAMYAAKRGGRNKVCTIK